MNARETQILNDARAMMTRKTKATYSDYEYFKKQVGWTENYDEFIKELTKILKL